LSPMPVAGVATCAASPATTTLPATYRSGPC
jgi:hypothetical protein